MAKYAPNEAKSGIVTLFVATELHAFLINDPDNTIDGSSSMAAAVLEEIAETGGYARKPVTLPAPTIVGTAPNQIATVTAPQQSWSATGPLGPFTKVVYARGATAVRGAVAGTLVRVEDVPGAPLTLESGQSFRHTATFEVGGTVT